MKSKVEPETNLEQIGDNLFTHKYSGYGGDVKCPLDKTTTVIGSLGLDEEQLADIAAFLMK